RCSGVTGGVPAAGGAGVARRPRVAGGVSAAGRAGHAALPAVRFTDLAGLTSGGHRQGEGARPGQRNHETADSAHEAAPCEREIKSTSYKWKPKRTAMVAHA